MIRFLSGSCIMMMLVGCMATADSASQKSEITLAALPAPTQPGHIARHTERMRLKHIAQAQFTGATNHCFAFAAVVDKATMTASSLDVLLTDLQFVFIGETLDRSQRRGPYYIGFTNDSGFKPQFQDGSPQIEHALAGLIIESEIGSGSAQMLGSFFEVLQAKNTGQNINIADVALFIEAEKVIKAVKNSSPQNLSSEIRRKFCA